MNQSSAAIIITFDQVIDTTSLDESTFSLTFPAPAQIIGTNRLISGDPAPSEITVTGTWAFTTNSSNQTVATFTPDKPLQQNTVYTAMLLGSDAALTSSIIKNPAGESMAASYSWGFTTGALNLQTRSFRPAATKTLARRRKGRPGCSFPGPSGAAVYFLWTGAIQSFKLRIDFATSNGWGNAFSLPVLDTYATLRTLFEC